MGVCLLTGIYNIVLIAINLLLVFDVWDGKLLVMLFVVGCLFYLLFLKMVQIPLFIKQERVLLYQQLLVIVKVSLGCFELLFCHVVVIFNIGKVVHCRGVVD